MHVEPAHSMWQQHQDQVRSLSQREQGTISSSSKQSPGSGAVRFGERGKPLGRLLHWVHGCKHYTSRSPHSPLRRKAGAEGRTSQEEPQHANRQTVRLCVNENGHKVRVRHEPARKHQEGSSPRELTVSSAEEKTCVTCRCVDCCFSICTTRRSSPARQKTSTSSTPP